jgi:hypothetical protein
VATVDAKLERYQAGNERRSTELHAKVDRQDGLILRRVEALERGRPMS